MNNGCQDCRIEQKECSVWMMAFCVITLAEPTATDLNINIICAGFILHNKFPPDFQLSSLIHDQFLEGNCYPQDLKKF